jgi:dipeptidase E
MDNPDQAPPGYDPGPVWDGLGLIDHAIVPHYRSPHIASAAAGRVARHLMGRGLRYRALRDGEVIVWTEDRRLAARRQRDALPHRIETPRLVLEEPGWR